MAEAEHIAHKSGFPVMEGHSYMSLKTFRKSGKDVPTPVWFAQAGGAIYVLTQANSGKIKRIRANDRVEIAPCDARGQLLGADYVLAQARILPDGAESKAAHQRLSKKYKLVFTLFMLYFRLRRTDAAYLEITPV